MRSPARATLPLAVGAAILLSAAAALIQAPYATGDEPAHIDYAYQVWRGELPVFEEGLEHRPPGALLPPVQWTAQHPPLYYLLVAPIVGPLAEAGHPVAAVYGARAFNVVLSGVLVLVAVAAARRIFPRRNDIPAIVALVVAAMAAKSHMGGSGYNDLLAAVLVTATFAVATAAIRHGLTARAVVALSVLTSLAALTRLSAGIVAVVIAGVVGLAAVIRARRRRWAPVLGLVIGGPLLVLAAAGWFYLRNIELTGGITGSHFDWSLENQPGRFERSVADVVLAPTTWLRMPNLFWWAGQRPPLTSYGTITMIVTAIALLFVPAAIAVRRALRAPRSTDRLMLGLLLVLPLVLMVAMQIEYRTNAGGMYPRYLLPLVIPICLAVAAGLASRPRWLVPIWTAITLTEFVGWVVLELITPPAQPWYYTEAPVPSVVIAVVAVLATAGTAWTVVSAIANRTQATTASVPAQTVSTPTVTS